MYSVNLRLDDIPRMIGVFFNDACRLGSGTFYLFYLLFWLFLFCLVI